MRRSPLKRTTTLGAGPKSLARGGTFASHGDGLARTASTTRRRPISPASTAQRAKVAGAVCLVDAGHGAPIDPAHLIDRSLGGGDDPLDVVPLCRACHREYDDGRLSLLEHLEPRWRDEIAQAVRTVGLIAAVNRITNDRYAPEVRS